jgi:hypothetical protein
VNKPIAVRHDETRKVTTFIAPGTNKTFTMSDELLEELFEHGGDHDRMRFCVDFGDIDRRLGRCEFYVHRSEGNDLQDEFLRIALSRCLKRIAQEHEGILGEAIGVLLEREEAAKEKAGGSKKNA